MSDSLFSELKRRNVFRVGMAYVVLAWVVIQVTDVAVPALRLPDWVNSVVFFFGLVGFPFALFFSWVFEMTPDGIKRETDIEEGNSVTKNTGQRLNWFIITALVFATGFMYWKSVNTGSQNTGSQVTESATIKNPAFKNNQQGSNQLTTTKTAQKISKFDPATIAALAFTDLSPNNDQEYFSDGISEEILNVLFKIKQLKVSSRTSSFQFKGRELGITEIAKQLKVKHVLEGSVRKAGKTIRITAQLIDAETDVHLWSETYDRPLSTDNLFAIQDEIAKAIVAELGKTLDIKPDSKIHVKTSTANLTAYELFLKARPLYQARLELKRAEKLLKQAVTLDPQYSEAWEIIAALQILLVDYGFTDTLMVDASKLAVEYANKALELNTNSALALSVLANVKTLQLFPKFSTLEVQVKVVTMFDEFNRSLTIDSKNPSTLNWRGLTYLIVGYLDLAKDDFKTCFEIDPYYEPCRENYSTVLSYQGFDENAVAEYNRSLNLGVAKAEYAPFISFALLGDEFAFLSTTNSRRVLHGWSRQQELYKALRSSDVDHQELITDMIGFVKMHKGRDSLAINLILIHLASSSLMNEIGSTYGAEWSVKGKKYRDSPDFRNFIKERGILEFWQSEGFPKMCKAEGDNDFSCD